MKKFNEWKTENNEHLDSEVLVGKLANLTEQIYSELKSFQGDRFKGFMELAGAVHNLKRVLVAMECGSTEGIAKYLTSEDCGEPHKPRSMKKIKRSEVVSKGVRHGEKDLSKDYKGHIGTNGDEEPFKVMK